MNKFRCSGCGYDGDRFIFQFNEFKYCVASNNEEPDYLEDCPDWVRKLGVGEAEIGEPIGCPACHAWGADNFELVS